MCGIMPATVALVASLALGAKKAELIRYTDSGAFAGLHSWYAGAEPFIDSSDIEWYLHDSASPVCGGCHASIRPAHNAGGTRACHEGGGHRECGWWCWIAE